MNFISRLLSFKSKAAQNQDTTPIAGNAVAETIPEHLFVEQAPPETQTSIKEARTIAGDFLDQDFRYKGACDGFNFHSNEILGAMKKEIKSRFSFVIDQSIQDKRQIRLKAENYIVEMAGISDEMGDKLTNTLREIDHALDTLRQQKELASMDEGWVMSCLRKYHTGFLQGMRDYIESESIFESTKIL